MAIFSLPCSMWRQVKFRGARGSRAFCGTRRSCDLENERELAAVGDCRRCSHLFSMTESNLGITTLVELSDLYLPR